MNLQRASLRAAALLLGLGLSSGLQAAEPPVPDPTDAAEIESARAELRRAQDEMERAAKNLARVTRERHVISPRAYAYEFVTDPDRAMLGVTIANGPERQGKLQGVLVTGVTPASGADKAGLKSGDLLLSANGNSLASATDAERKPVERLREVMHALKPGDQVELDYERAGKRAKATVTASRPEHTMPPLPMFGWHDDDAFDVLIPPLPPDAPPPLGAPWTFRFDTVDSGMQLARLDDDLAAYFKTKDGVLVVRPPESGTLGLKGGDVIRRINGRSVASPVAAWEELAATEDRPIRLDVVRHGKEIALEGLLPEPRDRRIERRVRIQRKKDE